MDRIKKKYDQEGRRAVLQSDHCECWPPQAHKRVEVTLSDDRELTFQSPIPITKEQEPPQHQMVIPAKLRLKRFYILGTVFLNQKKMRSRVQILEFVLLAQDRRQYLHP